MSFSSQVKAELCRAGLSRRCCAQAEAYGVLLYCGQFDARQVRITTESPDFAARLPALRPAAESKYQRARRLTGTAAR